MPVLDRYPTIDKPAHFNPSRLQADEIKLFKPLVAELEDLVGYLRMGGCTAGCGACCTAFVVPIQVEGLADEDFALVVHEQIILPIDPVTRGKAGFEDWEYWLAQHDAYLYQLPSGLLTAAIPVEVKSEPPTWDFDAWVVWLEQHGITMLRRFGQQLAAYVPVRCTQLTKDGLCGVSGTAQRPKMCASYPQHPTDVDGLDFCTYKFQPVKRGQLVVAQPARPQPKKRKKGKAKRGKRR
jgi:Fe-S-cluster containining protein